MSDHPGPEQVQDFVTGMLPFDDADEMRAHLADCDVCRREMDVYEGERLAIEKALAEPKLAGPELDRIVTDILDSPSGGVVGPRGRQAGGRDPMTAALLRAIPIGVVCGILTFIVLVIVYEKWMRSRLEAPAPAPVESVEEAYVRVLAVMYFRGESGAEDRLRELGSFSLPILEALRERCPPERLEGFDAILSQVRARSGAPRRGPPSRR